MLMSASLLSGVAGSSSTVVAETWFVGLSLIVGVTPTPTPTPSIPRRDTGGDADTTREPVKEFRFNTVNFPFVLGTIEMEALVLASFVCAVAEEGIRRKSTPLKERVIAFGSWLWHWFWLLWYWWSFSGMAACIVMIEWDGTGLVGCDWYQVILVQFCTGTYLSICVMLFLRPGFCPSFGAIFLWERFLRQKDGAVQGGFEVPPMLLLLCFPFVAFYWRQIERFWPHDAKRNLLGCSSTPTNTNQRFESNQSLVSSAQLQLWCFTKAFLLSTGASNLILNWSNYFSSTWRLSPSVPYVGTSRRNQSHRIH